VPPQHVDIAIVGTGFGGLGMAINLERAGLRDIVVVERAGDVGVTWYANSCPSCQCDVPPGIGGRKGRACYVQAGLKG
jgi:cation diffusion facilitator CzcD-associated flavoprotein CzcO